MLKLINHPLITHKLTLIRNKETGTRDFRQNINEIAGLMAYEITRDLPMREVVVETPLAPCVTWELSREIILVPVLRAGLDGRWYHQSDNHSKCGSYRACA